MKVIQDKFVLLQQKKSLCQTVKCLLLAQPESINYDSKDGFRIWEDDVGPRRAPEEIRRERGEEEGQRLWSAAVRLFKSC